MTTENDPKFGRFLLKAFICAIALVVLVQGGLVLGRELKSAQTLRARVSVLEHACIPVDTGGGVTQCRQPQGLTVALKACLTNPAYYADGYDAAMVRQCISDYQESR